MNIADRSLQAYHQWQEVSHENRAQFLITIAEQIEALGDALIDAACRETNLPRARFEGERGRTCSQLRMFASVVREGRWLDVAIDTAIPDRSPLPKPDLRVVNQGLGPIVVFGACNFPLAYSTCGGDTASAFAAACPVIYKVHPTQKETSALVTSAIAKAIEIHQLPKDIFIEFDTNDFGEVKSLVQHPAIQGVGFTGSHKGGMAIYHYAQERQHPIPVFCEMGSTNPVWLLPHALQNKAQFWAEQYCASVNLGVGQFCTNPGILIGVKSIELDAFVSHLEKCFSQSKDFKMLNEGIYLNYERRKTEVLNHTGVTALALGLQEQVGSGVPTLAHVDGTTFLANKSLQEEVFGPFTIVVACENAAQRNEICKQIDGQLTSTILHHEGDGDDLSYLTSILKNKAGRIVYNSVPTGVEVADAMVHGGPSPSSTDGRFTSVGSNAIKRWLRPVSYQNCPQEILPQALQDSNPLGIVRRVNGAMTSDAI